MAVFEVVIALLLLGAALAAVARRIGAPYPALVALAGGRHTDTHAHDSVRQHPAAGLDAGVA